MSGQSRRRAAARVLERLEPVLPEDVATLRAYITDLRDEAASNRAATRQAQAALGRLTLSQLDTNQEKS